MTDHNSHQTITPQHARTIASITAARNMLTRSLTDLTARGQEIPDQARTILEYLDTAAINFAQLCEPQAPQASIAVHLTPNEKGNPPGKLADAEIHFLTGPLAGSKLIGFAIWERRTGGGRNVTFPARQYSVNGERRSFALLRPAEPFTSPSTASPSTSAERVREMMLRAFAEYEHTRQDRIDFDQDGRQLAISGSPLTDAPADQSYAGPKDLCAEHADQPQLSPSRQLAQDAATQLQEMTPSTPEPVNPGIIMGTMIVEAVYGPCDNRASLVPTSPSAAPKVRRF